MGTEKTKKTINRRDALKALAAAGAGVVAASLLPGKWEKPAMQMGVLPVHAQSSVCNAEVEYTSEGFCESFPQLACGVFDYVGQFSYNPTYLTPTGVDVNVCGEDISSGMVAGAPGIVYVLIHQVDLECQGPRIITVTFNGGCVGVWESGPVGTNNSGSFFR
jgi:hypothetical protein